MTATAVVTQLATIESSLGLKEGTLHNPGELDEGRVPRLWLHTSSWLPIESSLAEGGHSAQPR